LHCLHDHHIPWLSCFLPWDMFVGSHNNHWTD
jgi:hypothetical protein